MVGGILGCHGYHLESSVGVNLMHVGMTSLVKGKSMFSLERKLMAMAHAYVHGHKRRFMQ